MFRKIKLTVAAVVVSFAVALVATPVRSSAETSASQAVCDSLGASGEVGGTCTTSGSGINNVLKTLLNILSFVAGVIAVIMIILAGIRFVTSQGESQSISAARNTVIYAVIGIIIVLLAQIIVRVVLSQTDEASQANNAAPAEQPCRVGQPC